MEVTRACISTGTARNLSRTTTPNADDRAELARLADLVDACPNPDAYAYATLRTAHREYRFRIAKPRVHNPVRID